MSRRKYNGPARKSRPTTFKDGPGLSSFDVDLNSWKPRTDDEAIAKQWRKEIPIAGQPKLPGIEKER